MASRYCQKSSSFLNERVKITTLHIEIFKQLVQFSYRVFSFTLFLSRCSYNRFSFQYKVFSFTLFLSRNSYNRSSFQYKVFRFTLFLLRSRRKLDEIKQSRRKLEEMKKSRRNLDEILCTTGIPFYVEGNEKRK